MSKTIDTVISELLRVRPHTYSDEDVAGWISRLDGDVSLRVEADGAPVTYSWPSDRDKTLFIPYPYDDVYLLYCIAQVDYFNLEYGQYANSYSMFNARLDEYLKYKARTASGSSASGGTSGSIGNTSAGADENHIIV